MLPKNEKEALYDVDDRISMLERRLDNAKAARDAFVHHLRGKYPNWTPPLPVMSYQEANFPNISSNNPISSTNFPNREPLLSRLQTSDYQWDVDEKRRNTSHGIRRMTNLYSNNAHEWDIPTSGPLLESDIRRTKIRLREISEELRSMRIDRMSLSTEQWLQEQSFRQHKSLSLHFGASHHPDQPSIDHLDQARLHLSRIDLTETSPVETPTEQRKIDIEMTEKHEQLVEEIREKMGGASEAPPLQVRFQDSTPILEQVLTAPAPSVVQAPVAQAPPPPVQAPPPPAQAPPSNVQSAVANLLGQFGGNMSDSDDSPRIPPPVAPPTQTFDYSQMLKNLGGGGMSSDEDDAFSRPSFGGSRPGKGGKNAPKSMMFGEDDSDVDEFFR